MLFVGRQGAAASLSRWLQKDTSFSPTSPFEIGCIYGSGGIGKTFLLEHCLHRMPNVSYDSFVELRIDGRNMPKSLDQMLCKEMLANTSLPSKELPLVFRELLQCQAEIKRILQLAESQLQKEYADSPVLYQALQAILSFGMRPQNAMGQRPYELALLNMTEEELEERIGLLLQLPAFQQETEWFSRLRKKRKGRSLRNALRKSFEEVLAEALFADLTRLFSHKEYAGKKLLWIFDDYESIDFLAGDFLVTYMLERLQKASFPSLLLFIGRDHLFATHEGWAQHYRRFVGERIIELRPFGRNEAMELMRKRGLFDSELCNRIWEETKGFPFLLDLECEDALSGGRSALGLKLFFDRLTRWMTPIQREWIVPLCFLDEINLESVSLMLPSHNAEAVLNWFKMEPAIRDPHAMLWQVLPFVRTRIQLYLKNDSPQRFRSLQERGKQIAIQLQEKKEP